MLDLKRLYAIASSQFGVDPRLFFRALSALPRYVGDWWRFRSYQDGRLEFHPCLHDRDQESGATNSEYFWQDLLVARMIAEAAPRRHVDVGSRVDGFVAHIASFRLVEVFDVRPLLVAVPGVVFRRADLMAPLNTEWECYCDSLSCLHALEHFGLGRYGDPVDPQGFERGLRNLAKLLEPKGTLYLSIPIGTPRVEFNAHRVSDPRKVLRLAAESGLRLVKFVAIPPGGVPHDRPLDGYDFSELAGRRYTLGLFIFVRTS